MFSFLFFIFAWRIIYSFIFRFFFGFYIGFLINIISITLGSLFFILISKYFLNNFFENYLSKYLSRLNKIIKKSSYEYLILIRLAFGIPLIVQNLFISTLEISYFKFTTSSLIGFSPYFLFFSYVGYKLSNLVEVKNLSFVDIVSFELILIIVFIISFILFRILRNIKSNK